MVARNCVATEAIDEVCSRVARDIPLIESVKRKINKSINKPIERLERPTFGNATTGLGMHLDRVGLHRAIRPDRHNA